MKKIVFISALILLIGCSEKSAWDQSKWIAMDKDMSCTMTSEQKYFHGNAPDDSVWNDLGKYTLPQFRKEFALKGEIEKAEVKICGIGQFDLFINGLKVGDHFLDPAWTQYDQEVAYVTFDVTEMLQEKNAVGVMLGGGFYNIPNERYHKIVGSMGAPKMRFSMEIEYKGGKRQQIFSDSTWKVTPSAITFSSIYGGEDFDATKYQPGWTSAGFDESTWQTPIECDFNPATIAQINEPLKIHSRLSPFKISKNSKGWVYDMGQNFSGIFEIEVTGKHGDQVKITPAELIKDGFVDQSSGGGPCWYTYTISGNETETWHPQFTYYGQRFFQIEGAVPEGEPNPTGLPVVKGFTGLHTCASVSQVGEFRCSNTLFNQILDMTCWAIRNNTASVMTDCPHREKLGWNEQLQLMFAACDYNYKLLNIYRNELDRMATAQREDGCVPTIAPEYVRFRDYFEDSPEWGSSMILVPWYIYRWYADSSLIQKHYPVMQRYMKYLESKKDDRGIVAYGLRDWLTTDPTDSPGITSHLTYIHDLDIMEKIALHLGKNEDATSYAETRKKAKDDFNNAFWNGEIYDNGNQAASAMALYMDVVPDELKDKVYKNLIESIQKRDYAIGVGEVAHPYLLELLREHGDNEIIFKIHSQRKAPGYAWCIDHGATALPEAWDGGMSRTHFCLGHIAKWFYDGIAGIRQAEGDNGWKRVVIAPQPVGDIQWVDCSFNAPTGIIKSAWKIDGDNFILQAEAPEGIDVEVILPQGYKGSYTLERK